MDNGIVYSSVFPLKSAKHDIEIDTIKKAFPTNDKVGISTVLHEQCHGICCNVFIINTYIA